MPIVKDFLGKKPAISDEVRGKNKEIRKKSIIFLSYCLQILNAK